MVTVSSSPSDPLSFPAAPFGRAVTGQRAMTFAFPKLIPWLAAKPREATIRLGAGPPFVVGFSYRWQLTIPHSNT
jgi:hypothetical protein